MPCRVSIGQGASAVDRFSWAATSWWQQGAASTTGASQATARARASSVAVSQACSASTHLGRLGELHLADRPDHEVGARGEPVGQPGVVVVGLLLGVDARQVHRQAADVAEVALGGQRQ